MCGIAGMLLARPVAETLSRIERVGPVLRHRGPDAFHTIVADRIALAQTRLRIVDLSSGSDRPFRTDRYALVYNGEIYNYRDIARELRANDRPVDDRSDTSVLFAALVHFGVERTLTRLRGMFAFAFADLAEGAVVLCRDRFGMKPLFYTQGPGGIFFASEIKAIAAMTPVAVDDRRCLLAGTIADHTLLAGRTIWRDVIAVAPGTAVACGDGSTPKSRPYFDPLDWIDRGRTRALHTAPDAALIEQFVGSLRNAVGTMSASDAPIGVLVSGGLDSGIVAALAVRERKDLSLFTADVRDETSEAAYATMVARHVGREIAISPFTDAQLLQEWAALTYFYECPIVYHPTAFPLDAVCRDVSASGVKAVLTGEGSDELFCGYPTAVTATRGSAQSPIGRMLGGIARRLGPRSSRRVTASVLELMADSLAAERATRMRGAASEALGFLPPAERRAATVVLELIVSHLGTLLHRNDRVGMRHSIEARFPFLDEDLVALALNLPLRARLRPSFWFHDRRHPFLVDKWVVRASAGAFLPRLISRRPKQGFLTKAFSRVTVAPRFFRDGYIQDCLELSAAELAHLVEGSDPTVTCSLASIEIFGRVFSRGLPIEDVTADLQENACFRL